jgi:hypothetical protein
MKAMIINGFGGADPLEMAEVPTPEAQADEVLIRVTYEGVNPVERKLAEHDLQRPPVREEVHSRHLAHTWQNRASLPEYNPRWNTELTLLDGCS